MIFNKDWTKEDNDFLRELIKEGKTPKEIVSIIGYDKLNKNPMSKYVGKYSDYILNNIFIKPKETVYELNKIQSPFKGEYNDYKIEFKTESNNYYIMDLICHSDIKTPFPNRLIYNISFNIKKQYNLKNNDIYNMETNKDELLEIMEKSIFILNDVNTLIKNKIKNPIYLICEIENIQKIDFYKNIIKNSLKSVIEVESDYSYNNGKLCYFYYENI